MQNRWATRVFKGKCRLPDRKTMWQEISERNKAIVDHLTYMDTLACNVGCMPRFVKLLLLDPRLAWHCYFGPTSAYQYRLTGPGNWDGARDAILGTMERILYPLNTRPDVNQVDVSPQSHSIFLTIAIPLAVMTSFGLQWWRTHY